MWTKTGWANVCLTHYGKIDTVPRRSENLLVQGTQLAYRTRRETNAAPQVVPQAAAPATPFASANEPCAPAGVAPREPGSDDEPALGIPLDSLERELMERANP